VANDRFPRENGIATSLVCSPAAPLELKHRHSPHSLGQSLSDVHGCFTAPHKPGTNGGTGATGRLPSPGGKSGVAAGSWPEKKLSSTVGV